VDKLVDKLLGNGLISGNHCQSKPVSYPSGAVKSITHESMAAPPESVFIQEILVHAQLFCQYDGPGINLMRFILRNYPQLLADSRIDRSQILVENSLGCA
jgi:hypothetical protein